MSQPKKQISVSLAQGVIDELNYWRLVCHDNDLLINRSDLIAILLVSGLESLESDRSTLGAESLVHDLSESLKWYYSTYDLTLRREDGVQD